ncbi:hypothetical protein [Nannocystis pusilla]|uniref:Uncharacterized protein n=1 Tax=Nannocystis pusilla TaxID=889268 RepID=A0ABS7TX85_9BACT|nr:hypothetical protein [Nannocystis pusilla]MBZ5712750.1 hypothetical protein [Nannocystis pusilla]
MPWYNCDPLAPHERGLRDPRETWEQREQRLARRVSEAHGVTHEVAAGALRRVIAGLRSGVARFEATEYGFASAADRSSALLDSPAGMERLRAAETWSWRPLEEVDLAGPLHAIQTHIRHSLVAHNLFHPDKKPALRDEVIGDPDYDPLRDLAAVEATWPEPREYEFLRHPCFWRTRHGQVMVVDGHHRVATDLLLAKTFILGRVLHQSELE